MEIEKDKLVIHTHTTKERKAVYAPFPQGLSAELTDFLKEREIEKLYCHQAEMFENAREGRNIVITTSTASGKTLSFLLPVLQAILEDPLTRAIFIYPTKALAADQYRALQPYLAYFGEKRISAGVYDGDTPPAERTRIRRYANIILTNPEMLNGAFLPNHAKYGFDFIFSHLRYVVVDELHTYRGVFGSHVANVFRRLDRICSYYKVKPQFLCSSATISNPLALAQEVCGGEFEEISRDGSGAPEKKYYLLQPPRFKDKNKAFIGQMQAAAVAGEMIPELVNEDHSFLVFCKSRRNVEIVLREGRDKLDSDSLFGASLAGKISGYRGGYTPIERRQIEQKMTRGELKGLVSTNALELGIDIGSVDTTILVGYPGTRASFWQQTGRAGRSGKRADNYLILESLPEDQYIGICPQWLFQRGSEHAIVDKNNLLIELAHIRAAAAELPLTLDDIALFPDLGESIPVLLRIGELGSQNGKFVWKGSAYPAGDFSLRNIDKNRYKLLNQESSQVITEMDELQAFREIHPGAIYMHDGTQYQVVRLDLEQHTAFAVPFKGDYYTMPGGNTEVRIIRELDRKPYDRTWIMNGDVNVNDTVFMYKKLQFHNHQNLGFEELREPLSKAYDSESTWIRIPEEVTKKFRSLIQTDAGGRHMNNNHFEGLCHAVLHGVRMVTMTEREDVGVTMSANAIGMADAEAGEVFLFIYDKFNGGLGYAKKAYDLIDEILDSAIALTEGCSCSDGCASCVGDYALNRHLITWALKSLKQELAPPENFKFIEYARRPVMRKQFRFGELAENWEAFVKYLTERGEDMAGFLGTVKKAEVSGETLTIYTANAFYAEWIMDPANKKRLLNVLHFYTEDSEKIRLKTAVTGDEKKRDLAGMLKRKYQAPAEESCGPWEI